MRSILSLVVALVLCNAAWATKVYVPKDDTKFTITKDDVVRITGQGIAGSQIKAELKGPAAMIEYDVIEVAKGHPLLGMHRKDFIVRPSGAGTVKVTVTVKPPQPDAKPMVTTYEFEAK